MSMKKLIVGNWKMNPKSLRDARTNFLSIKKEASKFKNIDAAVAAPFVYLPELAKSVSLGFGLAAQNISSAKEGAFTGEVSAGMIAPMKIRYVIVGHSERRSLGETNAIVNKKVELVLANKMTPIICVGETERDTTMWYLSVVKTQIEECLAGIPKSALSRLVIAYEPVWALSSTENRRDATPEDCQEMMIYIRKVLADIFGAVAAEKVRILYGGSVDEKNAVGFLVGGKADGLLPGRASLTPKKFVAILQTANNLKDSNDLR